MLKSKPVVAGAWWKRVLKWVGIGVGGIVLLFGAWRAYDAISDLLYEPKPKTVKAARPELGVVKLDPGTSTDGIPGWVAKFHLDVSVDHAWTSLSKCSKMAKALKGVASCTLLKKGDGWELNKMALTHPDGAYMTTKTWYDHKRKHSHWKMVDGSFQAAAGYVRLRELPGHPGWSQVEYGYFLKISIVLSKKFERPRVKRALRRMVHEIQRYFTKSPDELKRGQKLTQKRKSK
jgi:hypothetical protein